jgi:hypothetical protein
MRWSTVVSVEIGVAVLVFGLGMFALTGYWLILVPTWAFGALHINFAVRAWLRWLRRSAASWAVGGASGLSDGLASLDVRQS